MFCLLAAALLFLAPWARAVEVGSEGDLASVDIHAFVSQGFIATNRNNYLDVNTTHGTFQFSEVGINFTKTVLERLRMGVQFFAQDLGPTGTYNARVDWAYLDYRFSDWFGLRAGRVKIPFGLYNEIIDIDSARVAVLLPQSVYPLSNRDFLLAQTGGELYGYLKLGGAGAIDYHGYAGTIFFSTTSTPGSPFDVLSLNVPFLVGGRVMWETPLEGLRMGGSVQTLRLDTQLAFKKTMKTVDAEIPATLSVGSIEYSAHDLLLAVEYSRWFVKADSSDAMIYPPSPLVTSERAYAMMGYRATKWLQPGAYYSVLFPNVDQRDGRENMQHDVATTLRFDINSNWLLKLEGHYMIGTAGVTPGLNGNTPPSKLDRAWGVFLAKTTAYF
ncbi:MAG TPA: porin [Polyangiaceae bacterium]|nr:porin [Polyangiaceae bacterium]